MILSSLAQQDVVARLKGPGLAVRCGPFTINIRSTLPEIAAGVALLYAEHPIVAADGFADFHVAVEPPLGLRRWIRPKVFFRFDGVAPFKPLPRDQVLPALEWGMNWTIANHAHQYLIIHAAAIARNGRAIIMPGPPGAGKSTLCAALVHRGWRLLSDELALIELGSGALSALARPISLKNQSIAVIRDFAAAAVFGPLAHDTVKGTVALLKPPPASVARMDEHATASWIVIPEYSIGAPAKLTPESPAPTFIELGRNAFNYSILGRAGFRALADVIDRCRCLRFRYGSLDEAVGVFDRLADTAEDSSDASGDV